MGTCSLLFLRNVGEEKFTHEGNSMKCKTKADFSSSFSFRFTDLLKINNIVNNKHDYY